MLPWPLLMKHYQRRKADRAHNPGRRSLLRLGAATAALGTLGVAGYASSKRAPSPAVKPFQVDLPIPDVLQPTRTDANTDYYDISQHLNEIEILPGKWTPIWGYNGTFPGPTIKARRGRTAVVSHINRLKVPTVVHLHGGHTPAESDGYPLDLVVPVGLSPADFPICGLHDDAHPSQGQRFPHAKTYTYPNAQRGATLWYHDHAMDGTGHNVYMGMAGFYLIEDDETKALNLPSGAYDIPLMLTPRQFDDKGAFVYNPHTHSGAEGDVLLVNGAPWPRLDVQRRKYRFRILNAANSTPFDIALASGRPLTQIGTDGGLLAEPVSVAHIPMQMAERTEIVIDFARYEDGAVETLVNRLGVGPMGQIMQFRVLAGEVADDSQVPAKLIPIAPLTRDMAVRVRDFTFGSRPEFALEAPPIFWSINGRRFDPNRVDADPKLGDIEIWRFTYEKSIFPSHAHPPHVHLVHFQILSRNGKPPLPHERGWKDTFALNGGETVEVIARFDGYRGRYLIHCHNLEHEDHDMMARFDVI